MCHLYFASFALCVSNEVLFLPELPRYKKMKQSDTGMGKRAKAHFGPYYANFCRFDVDMGFYTNAFLVLVCRRQIERVSMSDQILKSL